MNPHEILKKIEELGISIRIEEGRLEIKHIHKVDVGLLQLLRQHEESIIQILCGRYPSIITPNLRKPYISASGELIIPFDCHPRYKYWLREKISDWQPVNESLSIREILEELGATDSIIEKYTQKKD